jgi:hypothetical protein
MNSAFDYRELARECMKEAEASKDAGRKKALLEIAQFYCQTALRLGQAEQDNNPTNSSAVTHDKSPAETSQGLCSAGRCLSESIHRRRTRRTHH